MNKTPLDAGSKHLLSLCARSMGPDGWAKVSEKILPLMKPLPRDLIEVEETENGRGRARLTDLGTALVTYL